MTHYRETARNTLAQVMSAQEADQLMQDVQNELLDRVLNRLFTTPLPDYRSMNDDSATAWLIRRADIDLIRGMRDA